MKRIVLFGGWATRRLRAEELDIILDEFKEHWAEQGYAPHTVQHYVGVAEHFGRWMRCKGCHLRNVDESRIVQFRQRHLPWCQCPPPATTCATVVQPGLRHWLRFLRLRKLCSAPPQRGPGLVDRQVRSFDIFLCEVRGLAEATRRYDRHHIRHFLEWRFGRGPLHYERLKPKDVASYLHERAQVLLPSTLQLWASSLRRFLRFLEMQGKSLPGLDKSILTPATHGTGALPKTFTDQERNRLLRHGFNRCSDAGRRDYLTKRRALGFALRTQGPPLLQFARYADRLGHRGPLTLQLAVRWARLPKHTSASWWAHRLKILRPFIQYRAAFDPRTEIPPRGYLGPGYRRTTPHIYSDTEIATLIRAAQGLRPTGGLRALTYATLLGLLACAGLRISEALRLRQADVDWPQGVISIRRSKFKQSRLVPLHPSALQALKHYLQHRFHKAPSQLTLADLKANTLLGFLDHLEKVRHNTVRTRNARWAAIRGFLHYALALGAPEELPEMQKALNIPLKRGAQRMLGFLSRAEVQAILAAPAAETWSGQRDRILFQVLYNTGARVSEIIEARVEHLRDDQSLQVFGKGRRQRTIPLWRSSFRMLRQWIRHASLQPGQKLFTHRWGQPLTRSGVAKRLAQAARAAIPQCRSLCDKRVSPHQFRHYADLRTMPNGTSL